MRFNITILLFYITNHPRTEVEVRLNISIEGSIHINEYDTSAADFNMACKVSVKYLRNVFFGLLVIGTIYIIAMVTHLVTTTFTYHPELLHNSRGLFQYDQKHRLLRQISKCIWGPHKGDLKPAYKKHCINQHSYLETNISIRKMKERGDNIIVFLYRSSTQPRSGVSLVSVIDPVTNRSCSFTSNLSMNKNSSVVIIPGRSMASRMPYRHRNQSWVFYTAESFIYVKPLKKYRFVFNHTMTYHKHADIDSSQFGFIPHQHESNYQISPKMKGKLVVWMASHCDTKSKREDFVEKLSRYISVDTYGECGKLTCPKDEWCRGTMSQYKFYVAFENSVCNSYITEKPWIGFALNMVPLVAGGGSEAYRSQLPPKSYIDVEEFKTVKDLADYLKILDNNDTLYREYFTWRSHYGFVRYTVADLSGRTCQYLHEMKNNGPHMVDLQAFANDRKSVCKGKKNVSWT